MTSISDTEVVNAPGGLVELGYAIAADSTTTATSAATGTNLATVTIVSDGSPILIEWTVGVVSPPVVSSGLLNFALFIDGSSVRDYWGSVRNDPQGSNYLDNTLKLVHRATLSAGTHTILVKAFVSSGTGIIHSGGLYADAMLRVSKIIQASQLLVTQSNAPIVTSLPSGNLVTGQEVDLYVTSPYAGYQRYKWNGSAWYVIGDSRAQGVWQSFTPTLTQSSNVTFNVNYAKYVVFGKTVMVNFSLSPTSSGVLNNTILLGFGSGSTALPTAASTNGIHGNFRWFDVGVSNWVGTICGSSTTSVFFSNDGNGNNAGFSGTLTNGDVIEGSFFYEMA